MPSIDSDTLLNKAELAEKLKLTVRGVECLMADGRIRCLRISRKCVRFNYQHVLEDLARFENEAAA